MLTQERPWLGCKIEKQQDLRKTPLFSFLSFAYKLWTLLCIGVTHTLFLFLFLLFFCMLRSFLFLTIYVSMSHFFCLSFHTSLLRSFAQHTHTLTVGTLAQCFATLESHSR